MLRICSGADVRIFIQGDGTGHHEIYFVSVLPVYAKPDALRSVNTVVDKHHGNLCIQEHLALLFDVSGDAYVDGMGGDGSVQELQHHTAGAV